MVDPASNNMGVRRSRTRGFGNIVEFGLNRTVMSRQSELYRRKSAYSVLSILSGSEVNTFVL